jgi:hypothetical protein
MVGASWAVCGISVVSYLRWLWREERGVARVLAIAVAILLICAPGFAVSEIAVLSTVQVAHAQHPAVMHLGAGTYDISQDIGDNDFPDDSTELSVTGPGGPVPVRTLPTVLTLDDPARVFLGAWDCYRVMSFTIAQAGTYQVTIEDRHGMSGAWISESWAGVARHVFPWAVGIVAALLAIALCLLIPGPRWRRMRRMASVSEPVRASRTAPWRSARSAGGARRGPGYARGLGRRRGRPRRR